MAPALLGPPVICGARPTLAAADADAEAPASHPFLDLLDAGFNDDATAKAGLPPNKTRTENGSATYAASGNPCLDLFFQVVPGTPPDRVRGLVEAAWASDPLTALRLVANLRGVRGTGKSDRDGFYAAALWVHGRHPRTLACNVPALAEFGYLKDFPELLYRLIRGEDARKQAKEQAAADKKRRRAKELRVARLAARSGRRAHARIPPPAPQPSRWSRLSLCLPTSSPPCSPTSSIWATSSPSRPLKQRRRRRKIMIRRRWRSQNLWRWRRRRSLRRKRAPA